MKNTTTYSNKTDAEVIDIYKNNCHWRTKQEIETYFYQKYSPLCKKYSYRYKYLSTMEDNMQECYLQMILALEWVDTNKISNVENYSFGVTFKGYLSSHFICEVKQYSDVEIELTENVNNELIHNSQENSIVSKLHKQEFENILSEKEQKIFKMLTGGMKKQDIAKKLGFKCTANLTHYTDKIKNKFMSFNKECELAI